MTIAEILGPGGRVHYRRPPADEMVTKARQTPGYGVRLVNHVIPEPPDFQTPTPEALSAAALVKASLPVKTYSISVAGFDAQLYSARTPGKARARAFKAYQDYDDRVSFRDFMQIAKVIRVKNPLGIGAPSRVSGKPATRILTTNGHYVGYMLDGDDTPYAAHPADIELL